jgi:hypothetical protein
MPIQELRAGAKNSGYFHFFNAPYKQQAVESQSTEPSSWTTDDSGSGNPTYLGAPTRRVERALSTLRTWGFCRERRAMLVGWECLFRKRELRLGSLESSVQLLS